MRVVFVPAVQTTVPSLLILGTDAVLAASPATAVQLAHACLALGFQAVIPASWGDELIAARALQRLISADAPRVQCSCPHVSRRLAEHGEAIAPMLLHFVPPPVAAAQYLRAAYAPARPRITYAGGCPAASDASIDAWLSVDALMATLAERGISTGDQPTEFDSVIPPDRRRYFSDPGGVPSRNALRHLSAPAELVELNGEELVVALAQRLLSESRTLIDMSVPMGCCCSGAVAGVSPGAARARVRDQEPPRALSPVVDHSIALALDATPPLPVQSATVAPETRRVTPGSVRAVGASTEPPSSEGEAAFRRRSPTGLSRPVQSAAPLRRLEAGRQLPRAFVARRRSSPRGMRQSSMRVGVSRFGRRFRWLWITAAAVAIAFVVVLLLRVAR